MHFTCPPVVGGVESIMSSHTRLLLGSGYKVRILAGRGGRFNRDAPLSLVPGLDSKHPPLLEVNEELERGLVSERFDALVDELTATLRPLLKALDVCIVHNALSLHFNLPLTVALRDLARVGAAPPLVSWCHDLSWTNPLYTSLMRDEEPWRLLRTALQGVSYVVVSDDRRRELEQLRPGERPRVISAGVDVATKLGLRRLTLELTAQFGFADAWPLMLLPARITKRKNIELAIRITRALRDLDYRPLLLVTGPPGPHNVRSIDYVDEVLAARETHDVQREVIFLFETRRANGRTWAVSDAMMDDLYQLADLLLFPSAQEGFGIPLLEAGLVRLPVWCSDIAPFREIGDGGIHVFGLEDDPRRIASRMATFLEADSSTRLRRRVMNDFRWDRIFDRQIEPLIESCIGSNMVERRGELVTAGQPR